MPTVSIPEFTDDFVERFMRNIDMSKGLFECWEWMGSKDAYGYGQIGRNCHMYKVHRVLYTYFVSIIPFGLTLDHKCRNRSCVNPSHLEPVSNHENILRGESFTAKQSRQTYCINGHPLSGENLSIRYNKDGSFRARQCQTCRRIANRKWNDKQKTNKYAF